MKRIFAAIALFALAACAAGGIPPPTVTFTPSPVAPGGTVQIAVQMKGNDNLPPIVVETTLDCEYFEEGAIDPTIVPTVRSLLTISGIPGPLVRGIKWRLALPPNLTFLTDPISTGYLGAATVKGAGVVDFTATALPGGVLATTIWTMHVNP